ncbi:MAG: glutathione S-transferase family protein, partial [Nannocystaceae bacterium]
AILDRRLDSRNYLLGDDFTLVDLIVGNAITYASVVGVPTTGHEHVKAWLARFHERPAFKKAWAVPS